MDMNHVSKRGIILAGFAIFFPVAIVGCGGRVGENKAAKEMTHNIERKIKENVPIGSNQSRLLQFLDSQKWIYTGFKSVADGADLDVKILGLPSGVFYCDKTGALMVTFHFSQDLMKSYTLKPLFACL